MQLKPFPLTLLEDNQPQHLRNSKPVSRSLSLKLVQLKSLTSVFYLSYFCFCATLSKLHDFPLD